MSLSEYEKASYLNLQNSFFKENHKKAHPSCADFVNFLENKAQRLVQHIDFALAYDKWLILLGFTLSVQFFFYLYLDLNDYLENLKLLNQFLLSAFIVLPSLIFGFIFYLKIKVYRQELQEFKFKLLALKLNEFHPSFLKALQEVFDHTLSKMKSVFTAMLLGLLFGTIFFNCYGFPIFTYGSFLFLLGVMFCFYEIKRLFYTACTLTSAHNYLLHELVPFIKE